MNKNWQLNRVHARSRCIDLVIVVYHFNILLTLLSTEETHTQIKQTLDYKDG